MCRHQIMTRTAADVITTTCLVAQYSQTDEQRISLKIDMIIITESLSFVFLVRQT